MQKTFGSKLITAIVFAVLVNSFSSLTAQNNKKFQGLLYEITGNGLKKPSYLYGTMHVSSKVAFHLSDTFFLAIKNADIIGLETNPDEWLDNMKDMNLWGADGIGANMNQRRYNNGSSSFYSKAFAINPPDNKALQYLLSQDPHNINGLLYRYDQSQENFEEDTYLDMFIYQSAKKSGKPVTNLEDFKESMEMEAKSRKPDENSDEDMYDNYNPKLYEDGIPIQEKIENAYRAGDLDLLDSLEKMTYRSKNFGKWMIEERNKVFVRNMDSIMKIKSLFTGVGAAHLPGDTGVIMLLKRMGYTVRPVNKTISKKAKKMMTTIQETRIPLKHSVQFPKDSLFSVEMPGKLTELNSYSDYKQYLYPEMINGSYYYISRIKSYDALYGRTPQYTMKRIDSLLYENIPGKILSKKEITNSNGNPGFDITNETKRGDVQRYHIYVCPDEIIIIKMGGTGKWVKDEGNKFFSTIKFRPRNNSGAWTNFAPKEGNFSVQIPVTYNYEDAETISNYYQVNNVTATEEGKNFYCVAKALYTDYDYIEEDTFELNQLGKEFAKSIKYEVESKKFTKVDRQPAIDFVLKNKTSNEKFFVKFIIKADQYFMLASKTQDNKRADKFFDSFKFTDFIYNKKFETYTDTNMYFTVESDFIEKRKEDAKKASAYAYDYYDYYGGYDKKKENKFEAKSYSDNFYADATHEKVSVNYYKYHDYAMFKNKDEFWKSTFKQFQDRNTSLVIKSKVKTEVKGGEMYDLILTDTNSIQCIYERIIMKDGAFYRLTHQSDTIQGLTKWAKTFFDSFKLKDTVLGVSPFIDKVPVFLKEINSTDSLTKVRVETGFSQLIFDEKYADDLMKIIESPLFDTLKKSMKSNLLTELTYMDNKKIIPFLKNEYETYRDSSYLEVMALTAVSLQKSAEKAPAALAMLKSETPLVSEENSEVEYVLSGFYDSLILAKPIFPELLDYTRYPEYKDGVYALLATLVDSGIVNSTVYAGQKQLILREANDELKRQLNNDNTNKDENSYSNKMNVQAAMEEALKYLEFGDVSDPRIARATRYIKNFTTSFRSDLLNYASILVPFAAEPNVKSFYEKLLKVKDSDLKLNAAVLMLQNKLPVADTLISNLCKNLETREKMYTELKRIKRLDKFDSNLKNQYDIVYAMLYGQKPNSNYYYGDDDKKEEKKDSIVFLEKRWVENKKGKGYVYFFKRKPGKAKYGNKDWQLDYVGMEPTDSLKIETDTKVFQKNVYIDTDKTITEQIDEIVEDLRNIGRRRLNSYGDYGGVYDDYNLEY